MTRTSVRAAALVFVTLMFMLVPASRRALAQTASPGSAAAASDATPAAQTARPSVTIVAFDSDRTDWVPPPRMGETIADLLGDKLVSSREYRVLDRQFLSADTVLGRRAPLDELRARAREAGVDYLILGSISRFSTERHTSGGGLMGFVPILGMFRSTTMSSNIGLTVRMVDVRTGEIVATAVSNGNASRSSHAAMGLGVVHGLPFAGGGGSGSSGDTRVVQADEALSRAVDVAGAELINAAARLRRID